MRQVFALAALCAFLASPSPGQEPSHVTETVSVNYVMIPFTVLGGKGVPLTELRQKDVMLLVDGVQVATDLFEKSMNAPVSFTILLDGSGSMALAGKMEAARAAVKTLVDSRKPGDDFALYVFDHQTAHEIVPFTQDGNAILKSLATVKPYGKTAFFDAVAKMPDRSELGKNPTRAIILLSDGLDNASSLTRAQLVKRLEGVSVPIYALGLREPAEYQRRNRDLVTENMSNLELLDEVASETGGKLFLGTKPHQFVQAVTSLDRALRAQYLMGFSPTGRGAVKYRRISLQVAGRARTVRVRAGYNGTEPPMLNATRKSRKNERKGS